jgi:gamma-glutamylcyclotransferase (GGCT)/AIG2-like uncharacterized protein YtfP
MELFAYGTLMDSAVWSEVAREDCPRQRAELRGYEARRLDGVPWPALAVVSGAVTHGVLYSGISAGAMARLDEYEGDWYVREPLEVVTACGKTVTAAVYLLAPGREDLLLPERWEPPS